VTPARVDGVRIIHELCMWLRHRLVDLGWIAERSGDAAATAAPAHRSTLIPVRPDLLKSLGELCSTDRYIKNRATSIGLMCEPGLAGSLLAEVATMTGKDRGPGWERDWPPVAWLT
jgi:hypothetical protein